MAEVIWKPVEGYEGLYEVSNTGIVRSLERFDNGVHVPSTVLKPSKNNRYAYVKLYRHSQHKIFRVHRLVALAFIPNPNNKPQVNHIDGNKMNNDSRNLEWCTQAENNRHAIDTGLQDPSRMIEATRKKVVQLSKNGEVIKVWRSLTDAANSLGIQVPNITHCCNGRIHSTGGFVWRYQEDC